MMMPTDDLGSIAPAAGLSRMAPVMAGARTVQAATAQRSGGMIWPSSGVVLYSWPQARILRPNGEHLPFGPVR
jgi:hypothetical protein